MAEIKNDVMGQFHNGLYLGDICERVQILKNVGHAPLAYMTAAAHRLTEDAERIAYELGDNFPSLPIGKVSSLPMPPIPVLSGGNWPFRFMSGIFEGGLDTVGRSRADENEEEAAGADWGDKLDVGDVDDMQNGVIDASLEIADGEPHEEEQDAGWDLEDLDLPPEVGTPQTTANSHSSVFVTPPPQLQVRLSAKFGLKDPLLQESMWQLAILKQQCSYSAGN